jgi:hypothetical protein
MTAKQLMLPAHRAFDSDGAPEAGATAHLYLSGTLTPALFYEDAALTVSLGSTITANEAGRFDPMPYQDSAVAFRLIVNDSEGTELDDIDPFYFGLVTGVDGISPAVATITDLKAVAIPTGNDKVRYLTQAGREGTFVFDSSNLSTKVTADPRNGIYVAPASASTGASGAWVRHPGIDTYIQANWFGMAVDNVTNDSPAIQAAVTLANALATPNFTGYGTASPTIQLPQGGIYAATKISLGGALGAITSSVRLIGEHSGYGRSATVLRFPANTTGIEIFAPSCSVENMAILGGWVFGTTAEGEYHGIKFHWQCTLRNLFLQSWQGDLIHGIVSSGSGGDTEGIANELYLERISGESGRCGLYLEGSDVNAGNIIALNFNYCRRASVYDISFLGNVHSGHQSSGAGINEVGSGVPYVACYNNGHLFQCILGQSVGASVNSPPATATSNAYWRYWKDAAATAYAPQWTNGMSVRDGGAYVIGGASATVNNPYSEGGEVPSQFQGSVLVLNGPDDGNHSFIRANLSLGAVEIGQNVYAKGNLTNEQGVNNQFLLNGATNGVDTLFTMDSGSVLQHLPVSHRRCAPSPDLFYRCHSHHRRQYARLQYARRNPAAHA